MPNGVIGRPKEEDGHKPVNLSLNENTREALNRVKRASGLPKSEFVEMLVEPHNRPINLRYEKPEVRRRNVYIRVFNMSDNDLRITYVECDGIEVKNLLVTPKVIPPRRKFKGVGVVAFKLPESNMTTHEVKLFSGLAEFPITFRE